MKDRTKMRVEFASNSRTTSHLPECEEFMRRIFGMDPGDYLISDESSLGDFRGINGLASVAAARAKVRAEYGFEPKSDLLPEIFAQIREGK